MKGFDILEKLASSLSEEYKESPDEINAWAKSAFDWMRKHPAGTIGAIGRMLVCGLLQAAGFTPFTRKNLVVVNGQRLSVKTSLMWGAGVIKFQNITDGEFDFILCLGIYPHESFGWLIPKDEVWTDGTLRDHPELRAQHGGADAWIGVDPENVPDWLKPYGGTLDQMIKVTQTNL